MIDSKLKEIEYHAKLIQSVADNEGWSQEDGARRLAILSLELTVELRTIPALQAEILSQQVIKNREQDRCHRAVKPWNCEKFAHFLKVG